MGFDDEALGLSQRADELERSSGASIDDWGRFDISVMRILIRAQTDLLALQRRVIRLARSPLHEHEWLVARAEAERLSVLIDEVRTLRLRAQGRILELKATAQQRASAGE